MPDVRLCALHLLFIAGGVRFFVYEQPNSHRPFCRDPEIPQPSYFIYTSHILPWRRIKYRSTPPGEVTVIRKMAPINLIMHFPKTEVGKRELAQRVSDVHASAVTQRLKELKCPTSQKLELLDAVIATAKSRQQSEIEKKSVTKEYILQKSR